MEVCEKAMPLLQVLPGFGAFTSAIEDGLAHTDDTQTCTEFITHTQLSVFQSSVSDHVRYISLDQEHGKSSMMDKGALQY